MNPIVFYDGQCALCHGTVNLILKHDKEGIFRFSPLQGELYQKSFSHELRPAIPDSVVLQEPNGSHYVRSEAVIRIFTKLSSPFPLLGSLLKIFPRGVRDLGYRIIAITRKRLFGTKKDLCPLVPDDLKSRFI